MSRAVVAVSIFASLLAAQGALSASPSRVQVATASALLIGFLVPAMFIGSLAEYFGRWRLVVGAAVVGALLLGWLNSLFIVKAEFRDFWYIKYPVFAIGFASLLFLHACVAGVLAHRTSAAN